MENLNTSALMKAGGIGIGAIIVLNLLGLIPIVGIACCCLGWLAYVGVGALYGLFAKQDGTPVDTAQFAIGGAIAGAAMGLVGGIVNGITSAIFGGAAMADAMAQLQGQGIDVPPELMGGATVGIGAILLGVCFAFVFAAVLGAAGGAIYAATAKDKPAAAV